MQFTSDEIERSSIESKSEYSYLLYPQPKRGADQGQGGFALFAKPLTARRSGGYPGRSCSLIKRAFKVLRLPRQRLWEAACPDHPTLTAVFDHERLFHINDLLANVSHVVADAFQVFGNQEEARHATGRIRLLRHIIEQAVKAEIV